MKTVKRRRKENKTDYQRRVNLLKGETPRIVFRKSNRYITSQYVKSEEAKDKVIFGFDSRILLKHGWPEDMKGSLKTIPAAYLLGLLTGRNIIHKKLETPILDFGMIRHVSKNRAFAFVKGISDSGIKISFKPEIFPEESKISGKNLKKDFSAMFNRIKNKIGEKNDK